MVISSSQPSNLESPHQLRHLANGVTLFGPTPLSPQNQPVVSQPTPPVISPKPDRPLNRDEVRELQMLLRKQGFNAGTPDGVLGPRTRTAAQAFVLAHKMKDAQDEPTLRLLNAARGH